MKIVIRSLHPSAFILRPFRLALHPTSPLSTGERGLGADVRASLLRAAPIPIKPWRLDKPREQFAATVHIEPFIERLDVNMDGMPADPKPMGDLFFAIAGEQSLQRLLHPRRKIGQR